MNRYYQDWLNKRSGARFRLIITPRGRDAIDNTTVPAWGAVAAGNYVQIPRSTFYDMSMPKAGYDTIVVGMPDAPTLKLRVNLKRLVGSADLIRLRDALLSPSYENRTSVFGSGATFPSTYPGPLLEIDTNAFRAIDTSNHFLLLTDYGTGGSLQVMFDGAQRPDPQTHVDYDPELDSSWMDIELVHSIRMIFETILPNDLFQYMTNHATVVPAGSGTYNKFYDVIYAGSTGTKFYRTLIPPSAGNAYLVFLENFFTSLSALADSVYKSYRRDDVFFAISSFDDLGPYGYCTLYGPNHVVSNFHLGQVGIGVCFVSQIYDGSGVQIGGWLWNDGTNADTIYHWKNAYDMLKEMSESTACFTTLEYLSSGTDTLLLKYQTMDQVTGRYLNIKPGDFIGRGYKFVIGANVIGGATTSVAGFSSPDRSSWDIQIPGSPIDSKFTVPSVFHNLPTVGARDDVIYSRAAGDTVFEIASPLTCMTSLWYLDTASALLGTAAPIRPHHYVDISGSTGAGCTDNIALPNPAMASLIYDYGFDNAMLNFLWYPLRLVLLQAQAEACLPFAAANVVAKRFSFRKQTIYPAKVQSAVANLIDLGYRTPSTGPYYWASGYTVTGEDAYEGIPGTPTLLSTSWDGKLDLCDVELLAVGT